MTKIKCYAISCSSDGPCDVRNLFVWGETPGVRWLSDTPMEARKRVKQCRKETKCQECDAEIHKIIIERNKTTLLQRT